MIYLGFDTSNYTTSVACCGDEEISLRKILTVKSGERGLRQSDAVFQHMKRMPELFLELSQKTELKNVAAVGVSTKPRNVQGSYMPVFLSGEGYARVVSSALGVPLYSFSHQDGHIMSGIESCKAYSLLEKPFLAVHISGGTTEILLSEYKDKGFKSEIIGGTRDISAGQLIDRVGVALGLDFPCGREMDSLSQESEAVIKLPVNVSGTFINFSGIETKALSLVKNENKAVLIKSLFVAEAKALTMAINNALKAYGLTDALIVGGVASNSLIRKYIMENCKGSVSFASYEMSCDNAFGIARLAMKYHSK